MTIIREEVEHAYNNMRRLRLRLSTLARLAAGHAQDEGRAERVVAEAVSVLDACACTFHCPDAMKKWEGFARHKPEDLEAMKLELIASRLAEDVARSHESLAVPNLAARPVIGNWLSGTPLRSYLGLPLFDSNEQLRAVVGIFGGANREFNEEDEWWLRAAAQPVADELDRKQLETKLSEVGQTLMREPESVAGENVESKGLKVRPCVLVVDDDRYVNDLICEYLTMEGFRAEAAFNGLEAMQLFRPAEHKIVMTDVAMPLMNGWELIAALRVRAPELPVVLLTGYGSGTWNENYLRRHGVHAVLSKPVELLHLTEILEGIAAHRELLTAG